MSVSGLNIAANDVKTILFTVVATLIATGIAWSLSRFLRKTPKILWVLESDYFDLRLTKDSTSRAILHKILIENVGSAAAMNVVVTLPKTESKVSCSAATRNWFSIDHMSPTFSEVNFTQKIVDDETILAFPRVEKAEVVEIRFVEVEGSSLKPKGVIFDGEVIKKITSRMWFMNKNRLYWSVFWGVNGVPVILLFASFAFIDLALKILGLLK